VINSLKGVVLFMSADGAGAPYSILL